MIMIDVIVAMGCWRANRSLWRDRLGIKCRKQG